MFPLILIITLFGLAGFMGWLMHTLDDNQQAFKFFYFFLMLMFLLVACYQTSLLAYEPEARLNYTVEAYTYGNYTDAGGGNSTQIANITETQYYGNYTSQYHAYGGVMVSIAWVMGTIIFMMLLIMVVTWGFTILDKYRKGGKSDEIPNEYAQGF